MARHLEHDLCADIKVVEGAPVTRPDFEQLDYCLNFCEARDMDPVTRNVVVAWVRRNRTVFPVAPKSFDEKVLAFVDALLARIDALTAQREKALLIHHLRNFTDWCHECGNTWPCETVRALDALDD